MQGAPRLVDFSYHNIAPRLGSVFAPVGRDVRPNGHLPTPVNPRLEKRLKDFAHGGLCLLWKRQSMYVFVSLLAAIYISPALALVSLLVCQTAEVFDFFVFSPKPSLTIEQQPAPLRHPSDDSSIFIDQAFGIAQLG